MLLDLLTYRWTVVSMCAVSFAAGLALMATTLAGGPKIGWSVLSLAAPALGVIAFAGAVRHKPLVAVAATTNAVQILLSLPYLYFAVRNGIPAYWFVLLAFILFLAPVVTVAASVVRWSALGRAAQLSVQADR